MTSDRWYSTDRIAGLRQFAVAITVFNILGHTVFGFEQSWAQLLISLTAAYTAELLLEVIDAWATHRPYKFAGAWRALVDFFLPAHITGLAVAMLLYANDRLMPIVFASVVAIASKALLHARMSKGRRHFFNPSNLGITVTLLAFPWVGIAPPYHFTENLTGSWDWILPGLILGSGTMLNLRFARRLPLVGAWALGFAVQAAIRSVVFGTPLVAALIPMTGVAFVLFSMYMVTDPATTPSTALRQVAFGVTTASVYGLLVAGHVVFGLFFALTVTSLLRALAWYALASWRQARELSLRPVTAPIAPQPAVPMLDGEGSPVRALALSAGQK